MVHLEGAREGTRASRHVEEGLSMSFSGHLDGNPLQCSRLENPRDREPGGLPSMGSHRGTIGCLEMGGEGGRAP